MLMDGGALSRHAVQPFQDAPPVEPWVESGFHWMCSRLGMHMQHLPTRCNLRHNNHFTLIILFFGGGDLIVGSQNCNSH